MTLRITDADATDFPAITALFNQEIREGLALWNTRERSLDEMTAWASERRAAGFPLLAARDASGAFLGYASFGSFRPHDGYAHSVEHSLYVVEGARRRGVGAALLSRLETRARERGAHVMIGGLEAGNQASHALHLRHGFVETARMPEVGRKFGRWLTLVFMQKRLASGGPS